MGNSIIVGGVNYGQGSSREHAALVPLYLGIRAVVAKSFARIHKDNLINAGILPMTFADPSDYDKINEGDEIELSDLHSCINTGKYYMTNKANGAKIALDCVLSERQIEIVLAGGLIAATAQGQK
jgi:aconitate hydratase